MIETCNLISCNSKIGGGNIIKRSVFLAPLLLLFALPSAVVGQVTANPYASAQIEHDSNVFRFPNSQAAFALTGDPILADTDERYIAGLSGTDLWSLQKLTGTIELRRIEYDHFSYLDHNEYLANLQLDWKLGTSLDGMAQVRQEHLQAPFAERDSAAQLELNTDRSIVGKLNYTMAPEWRLETGVTFHTLDTPLQFYPDFVEHEVGTHLGVSYLGVANLTYGIAIDHIDGNYSHAIDVGPYSQTSAVLRANYLITGLTSLAGSIGYTKRDQTTVLDGAGDVSGATGNLAYKRQLTGKTALVLQVTRAVDSYAAAGGSELDTTASVGLTWQASYKVAVTASYAYTRSTFAGQVIPGAVETGRLDHSPATLVNVTYQALRHLQIKAYLNAQDRRSNYDVNTYSDTTIGIQVRASLR